MAEELMLVSHLLIIVQELILLQEVRPELPAGLIQQPRLRSLLLRGRCIIQRKEHTSLHIIIPG